MPLKNFVGKRQKVFDHGYLLLLLLFFNLFPLVQNLCKHTVNWEKIWLYFSKNLPLFRSGSNYTNLSGNWSTHFLSSSSANKDSKSLFLLPKIFVKTQRSIAKKTLIHCHLTKKEILHGKKIKMFAKFLQSCGSLYFHQFFLFRRRSLGKKEFESFFELFFSPRFFISWRIIKSGFIRQQYVVSRSRVESCAHEIIIAVST